MDTKPLKPFQRSWLKYPDTCLFTQRATEHKNQYGIIPKDLENLIHSDMRQALAHHIVYSYIQSHDHDFYKEYQLQLYVFTPDEFHEMVENEVQRQLDLRSYSNLEVKP